MSGPTFYQLHLLFDKHYAEQATLVDAIAERIQLLGGVSLAMAGTWPRRPSFRGRPRGASPFLCRFLGCSTRMRSCWEEARAMARLASEHGDDGTNDLLVSDVIRTNELQAWFVAEHVVDTPVVRAE